MVLNAVSKDMVVALPLTNQNVSDEDDPESSAPQNVEPPVDVVKRMYGSLSYVSLVPTILWQHQLQPPEREEQAKYVLLSLVHSFAVISAVTTVSFCLHGQR